MDGRGGTARYDFGGNKRPFLRAVSPYAMPCRPSTGQDDRETMPLVWQRLTPVILPLPQNMNLQIKEKQKAGKGRQKKLNCCWLRRVSL